MSAKSVSVSGSDASGSPRATTTTTAPIIDATPANAAIAVTRGALERFNRAELQGVIAHEFSHILNGDMRLNQQLMGLSFGILALAQIGRWLLRSVRVRGGGAADAEAEPESEAVSQPDTGALLAEVQLGVPSPGGGLAARVPERETVQLRATAPGHAWVRVENAKSARPRIVLRRARALVGRLVDPSGRPVGDMRVEVFAGGRAVTAGWAGPSGFFRLYAAPGRYRLLAWEDASPDDRCAALEVAAGTTDLVVPLRAGRRWGRTSGSAVRRWSLRASRNRSCR